MDLTGRRALLTGATGGLGRATAEALAGRGAHVILSSRKAAELEKIAATLPGKGHATAPADLAEPGAAEQLAADAVDVGDVDILIANAGLPGTGRMEDLSVEEINSGLRVNLEAPIQLAKALAPAMKERGSGHLVFVASLSGKAASPRSSIYNATKFGLRGFALALRMDLHGSGVGVSIVSPGFIRDAGMFANSGAKPPPGFGTSSPEQVAEGVLRAIDRDKAEVAVAPLRQRAMSHFALFSPGLSGRAQSGSAGQKAAAAVADGHKKRT